MTSQISVSTSLSARRAWIEIETLSSVVSCPLVALRKESVDRNVPGQNLINGIGLVALRKESVDRNDTVQIVVVVMHGRSPQGERG